MDGLTAIESMSRECFRSFAAIPGATLLDGDGVYGVRCGVPITFFNGIASTDLDSSDLDGNVERVIESFRREGTMFRWWLTPSTRPRQLDVALQAHGMRHAWDAPGMAADLAAVSLDAPSPLPIERIESVERFGKWLDVFVPTFARPDVEAAVWRDGYAALGYDREWIHFVALADGDAAAATTSLLLAGELAGIYHVATLPQYRGRGIGAAVTREAMRYARDRGAKRAALQSSEMGLSVYRALGFEELCTLSLYDWRPEYER